jgi:predicted tellurium resistance membrane protein TerC
MDAIFSLDSVITAVRMVDEIWIMVAAVVVAVTVMPASVGAISRFVDRHPTVKMLALSFLLLIGMVLVAEGFGQHVPKGYIDFAPGSSIFVEMLNLRLRRPHEPPVKLHEPYAGRDAPRPSSAEVSTR